VAYSPRIEELKRRVQSDPASIAFAALAEEYRRAGRFDEAIDTCKTGLTRHPSYLSAHVTLGRAFIEVGRLQDAREELEYVLKLAPENLAAIRGLAEIHHRIGDESTEQSVGETDASPEPVNAVNDSPPGPIQLAVAAAAPEPEISSPGPITSRADEMSEVQPAPPVLAASNVPDIAASASLENHLAYRGPVDPALAGLEEFLNAIIRARSQRAAAR
jgi:tetratricopeptide (TPR) repeat protein